MATALQAASRLLTHRGNLDAMDRAPDKRLVIGIGIIGILIEVTALVLLGSKRIAMPVATPLILMGMLMAFVPSFVVVRRARRK